MTTNVAGRSLPLIDAVRPQESDGPLVSAVMSTYGLSLEQPNFFEQDFLPTLLGLGGVHDRGYTAPTTLERKLAETDCTLICDAHAVAEGTRPSLHIEVIPVGGRTQHAKIVIIHRKRLVRLIVSSANLTHSAYRLQREAAAVLDFRPEGALPVALLRKAVDEFAEVLDRSAGAELKRRLAETVRRTEAWGGAPLPPTTSLEVVFGGGARPLWRRLVEAWPEGEPLLEWTVCSPFWPSPTDGMTPFELVSAGLSERGSDLRQARLEIVACADSPGPRPRPVFPFPLVRRLRDEGFPIRTGRITPARLEAVPEERSDGAPEDRRDLHAKWVLLRGPKTAVALLGSANFTRKGMGALARPETANIEACVLVRLPAAGLESRAWLPPLAADGAVDWSDCGEADFVAATATDEEPVDWPAFVVRIDAEVYWGGEAEPNGRMRVETAGPHPDFRLAVSVNQQERTLLVAGAGAGGIAEFGLDPEAVRGLLAARVILVRWGEPSLSAPFPVNITQQSRAGLPTVLGARPDEQQLLAYFHGRISEDDLIGLLERRAVDGAGSAADMPDAGRLRQLQSYVLRDFVESLYGLEEVLRQSAHSPRSFEQALIGEFSPAGLAEQVCLAVRSGRRSPTAGAFQLVELVRVVASLAIPENDQAGPDDGRLLEDVRRAALDRLLAQVRIAAASPGFREACLDKHFAEYVSESLPKACAALWQAAIASQNTAAGGDHAP